MAFLEDSSHLDSERLFTYIALVKPDSVTPALQKLYTGSTPAMRANRAVRP